MQQSISAGRVAALVGPLDGGPAYASLEASLRLLIGDGRIGYDVRLPSERDLTATLGLSRTTVARAYAGLRESGYAAARQGSGTFTRVPGGRSVTHDHALSPRMDEEIDLGCAATGAAPGLTEAFAGAATDLPAYLGGHGYFLAGLPVLQEAIAAQYTRRGLPTDPRQVVVTPGALAASALVSVALTQPGTRVLVESPVYPNAVQALRTAGARVLPSPVDGGAVEGEDGGWAMDEIGARLRQVRPALAYLVPDFQNPTGHLMADEQRAQLADHLAAAGTTAVVDEAHHAIALDDVDLPLPLAAHAPGAISLGSAAKAYWGGLRLGWVRAPHALVDDLLRARLGLDLGTPVMEQLVLRRLLDAGPVLPGHLDRLREQRDTLVAGLREHLPSWRFRVPAGGLSLWCALPAPLAVPLAAAAEERGVAITPGPVFAIETGLSRYVRIAWTRPAAELADAVPRLAAAWAHTLHGAPAGARGPERMTVA
ncbi:MocR-like transcription factor YczR [Nocardioides bruguierae]|uniref:PLP-dependent aminotransferase family protein n=1 Tax=Nocardioides bruguierae TaxID=2945102 RepID=A0A9X2D5A9_9ACTN|nr:PLP-dependent aminotransferase family protein [Nocardioides bruguierae]MCM0619722.1 PLP-dependent aminotransferase family protein [Nocardioides bruguierae]